MICLGEEKQLFENDTEITNLGITTQHIQLLQVARSNILLNFLLNILLMYQKIDSSVNHIDLEMG